MISREQLYQTHEYWLERIQNDIFRMVHHYMKEKHLNQSALAKELGVSKGYISQIVNGNFNFSLTKLIELSLALGVAPKVKLDESLQEYTIGQETNLEFMNKNGFMSIQLNSSFSSYPLEFDQQNGGDEVYQVA